MGSEIPIIRGADAAPDLKALRNMIDGGSGYPPHWRGETTDVNLATGQAMQEPAERHLARHPGEPLPRPLQQRCT